MRKHGKACLYLFGTLLHYASAETTSPLICPTASTSGVYPGLLSACAWLSSEVAAATGPGPHTFVTYVTLPPITYYLVTRSDGSVYTSFPATSVTHTVPVTLATSVSLSGSRTGAGGIAPMSTSQPSSGDPSSRLSSGAIRSLNGASASLSSAQSTSDDPIVPSSSSSSSDSRTSGDGLTATTTSARSTSITKTANSSKATGSATLASAAAASATSAAAAVSSSSNHNYRDHVVIPVAVVCSVVPVLLILLLLCCCIRRRKTSRERAQAEMDNESKPITSDGPPVLPMIVSPPYPSQDYLQTKDDASSVYEVEGNPARNGVSPHQVYSWQGANLINHTPRTQETRNPAGEARAVNNLPLPAESTGPQGYSSDVTPAIGLATTSAAAAGTAGVATSALGRPSTDHPASTQQSVPPIQPTASSALATAQANRTIDAPPSIQTADSQHVRSLPESVSNKVAPANRTSNIGPIGDAALAGGAMAAGGLLAGGVLAKSSHDHDQDIQKKDTAVTSKLAADENPTIRPQTAQRSGIAQEAAAPTTAAAATPPKQALPATAAPAAQATLASPTAPALIPGLESATSADPSTASVAAGTGAAAAATAAAAAGITTTSSQPLTHSSPNSTEPANFVPQAATEIPRQSHDIETRSYDPSITTDTEGEFVTPMTSQFFYPGASSSRQDLNDDLDDNDLEGDTTLHGIHTDAPAHDDYEPPEGAQTPRVSYEHASGEQTPEVNTASRVSVTPYVPRRSSKRVSSSGSNQLVTQKSAGDGSAADSSPTMPGSWYDASAAAKPSYNDFDFGFQNSAAVRDAQAVPGGYGIAAEDEPPRVRASTATVRQVNYETPQTWI